MRARARLERLGEKIESEPKVIAQFVFIRRALRTRVIFSKAACLLLLPDKIILNHFIQLIF
jgi:hypothetical protein